MYVRCETAHTICIPFECNEMGQIYLPLVINGTEIIGVFDSGSPYSVIGDTLSTKVKMVLSSLLDYGYFPFLYDDTISLKVSKSVFFHVRNLRSESKIAFRIIPNSNNFALWGNDIIDQYNWFFDYNTMLVTISNKPIDINVQNSIKIAYENKLNPLRKTCTLFLPKEIQLGSDFDIFNNLYQDHIAISDVLLDSGYHGYTKVGDKIFSYCLMIVNDAMYGKLIVNGEYKQNCVLVPTNGDSYVFNHITGKGNPVFNGVINISEDYNFLKKIGVNGILPLGKNEFYSGMYLDTKNHVVYLLNK